jgi:hypothetical protein
VLKGVIYADAGGSPGALLATSNELTYSSSQAAGCMTCNSRPRSPYNRRNTGSE